MKKIFLVLVCIPFLLSTQCNDDDVLNCPDESYDIYSLESVYDCENTKYDLDLELENDYVLITNQDAFDVLITGNCMAEIDFTTYTLLIGKQGLTSGNTSIDYTLTRICEQQTWDVSVTFNQNETAEAPNLTYHLLIPTTSNQTTVRDLDIIIN